MDKGRLTPEFKAYLETQGYFDLKEVDGKIIGLLKLMYTIAIVVDIDEIGYDYRYCYPYRNAFHCIAAYKFFKLDEEPFGNWAVRKGRDGDYRNPNFKEEE